jgi:nucleotide-binding universal stress UspA family protein
LEFDMIAIRQILVATDFGPASDNALRYGQALAREFSARLHVLHAAPNVFATSMDGYGYAAIPPEVQEDLEKAAQRQMAERVTDEDRRDLQAKTAIVVSNSPATAIVDYATQHAIELIIVGTHGRGAVAHVFLGNVAERVVRSAPCPVLTVRDPEHEFVLPDALVAVDKQEKGKR